MRKRFAVAALAVACAGPAGPASAQNAGSLHDLVDIRSTAPRISDCGRWSFAGCFRIFVQVRSRSQQPIFVSYSATSIFGQDMAQSYAYLAGGQTCHAKALAGMDSGDRMARATSTSPIRIVVQFNCDGALKRGESAAIDVSLWVKTTDSRASFERFSFPDRPLS